jgi:L-Lysine epsilon oxidase N-terminal
MDGGTFLGQAVKLGEIRADPHGDLLVLGGSGVSQSVTPDGIPVPITHSPTTTPGATTWPTVGCGPRSSCRPVRGWRPSRLG